MTRKNTSHKDLTPAPFFNLNFLVIYTGDQVTVSNVIAPVHIRVDKKE